MATGKVAKGPGLRSYYQAKIEEMEIMIRDKSQNLRRLEAQRNELNSKGAYTARRLFFRIGGYKRFRP